MNAFENLIKELGRALHEAADNLGDTLTDDHATREAHYAAAEAIRDVANTIGNVFIGTEDFRTEADKVDHQLGGRTRP